MPSPPRDSQTVFVVDDDPAVRDSLQAMLSAAGYRCTMFASGADFLASDPGVHRGCVLVDVRMPGMDGLELQRQLKARGIGLPVIFMTGFGEVPLAVEAMKAGAVDFVEKPSTLAVLEDCIDRALAIGAASQQAAAEAAAARERIERLTPRERDVLRLLVAGKPNKIIAFELSISPRTVEIHRARVMDKMAVKSLSELVRLSLAAGERTGAGES
jgi:two-component system response regulator FixJ